MRQIWTWLNSDAGVFTRIAIGSLIFLALAITDWRRHGRRATRWREYLFLIAVVAVAMLYGAANDLITSRISWEYFYYGKDLAPSLGPATPPDRIALALAAALVGIKATWYVGLVMGVAMLFANNPKPGLPQCPYSRLLRLMPLILLCCLACSIPLGAVSLDHRNCDVEETDTIGGRHARFGSATCLGVAG